MSRDAVAAGRETGSLHAASTRTLLELLDEGERLAAAAAACTGLFRTGGPTCRIVGNDTVLAERLTRCLVATDDGRPPDFTLSILSGSAAPGAAPPPWNLPHTSQRHLERLHIDDDTGLRAFYDHDRRFWIMGDAAGHRGLMWIAASADLPAWEEAAPFKSILNWLFAPSAAGLLHGGVVTQAGRGVLLAGPGGSGKSTTVMAAVAAGLGTCGDDLVVVEEAEGFVAHALYDAVKFFPSAGTHVPPLFADGPARPCGDKLLVRYSDVAPERFLRQTPLVALAQCVLTGSPTTTIAPLTPAAMLRSLGPPTAFLLRGAERDTLRKAAAVVRGLPTFTIALGTDPQEAAGVLGRWLEAGPS